MISLVIIHDLAVRLSDFSAHYTDHGVLPMQAWQQYYAAPGFWTWLGGNSAFSLFLFASGLLASVMLMIGKHTRLMAAVCWVVLLSVQNRNPILYQGGDDMLRIVLFWYIWLPAHKAPNGAMYKVTGWAVTALLLQSLCPLFFSGLYKGTLEWWSEGTAFYYALQLDQLTRHPGLWLRDYPAITIVLTRLVYLAELLVLPVFLMSVFKEGLRTAVFITMAMFSVGIATFFMIGLFPLCIFACSVLFIPTSFWQKIVPLPADIVYHKEQGMVIAWTKQFILLFAMVLVLWWNLADVGGSRLKFPPALRTPMYALRLNQSWGMFAPTVFKEDGWLVLAAKLKNGETIDLNNDNMLLDFSKPAYVLNRFKNDRWRKYTEQVFASGNQTLRLHLANYLIYAYNNAHSDNEQIEQLAIYYMLERTQRIGKRAEIEKVLLYETALKQ